MHERRTRRVEPVLSEYEDLVQSAGGCAPSHPVKWCAAMKYLCLAYYDTAKLSALTAEQMTALESQCPPHDAALRATGKLLMQGSLGAPESAASIRPSGGRPSMSDGPFIETNEQIGGMFIIEAGTLSEALAIASQHPAARVGGEVGWGIEVRPIEQLVEYAAKSAT
jgi:hypothetical protein